MGFNGLDSLEFWGGHGGVVMVQYDILPENQVDLGRVSRLVQPMTECAYWPGVEGEAIVPASNLRKI